MKLSAPRRYQLLWVMPPASRHNHVSKLFLAACSVVAFCSGKLMELKEVKFCIENVYR